MRVAIVGNGPSAQAFSAEIDGAGIVVRCTDFAARKPPGYRLDVWAWYGNRAQCPSPNPAPQGDYRVWCTVPTCAVGRHQTASIDNLCLQAGGRFVDIVPDTVWGALSDVLGTGPSTGLSAIGMAMHLLRPSEVWLFGFDATEESKDEHNFKAEKLLIAKMERHEWLGRPMPTRLTWFGKPAGIP